MEKGVFICLEGLDGCGKTTQAKLLVRRLERSYDAIYTSEPSHGKIGKFIRERYLRSRKRGTITIEALLFAADRVEHVNEEVLPALQKGKVVVSDRYLYSSLAYQGAGGLELDWIRTLNVNAIPADLALFIDVEPEIVMTRLKPIRSVMENLETQKRVRDTYLKFVNAGELVTIDGNRSKKDVAERIFSTVNGFLEKKPQIPI